MNRLTLLSAALVFAFGGMLFAQPQLEIKGGDVYEWGTVSPKDSPLKARIILKNIGNEDLNISGVKPGCGCTTPNLIKNLLKAGDTTALDVGLNLGSNVGEITKSLTISSNDPKNGSKVMFLKANIVRALTVAPNMLAFNDLEAGKEGSASVKIMNSSKQDITLSDFAATNGVTLNLTKTVTLKAGAELELVAKYRPKDVGNLNSTVTFKTSHSDYPTVEVPAYGMIKEAAQSPIFNTK